MIEAGQRMGSRLQSIGQSTRQVGQKLTVGLTAPITAGLGLAVREALAFEEATADLNKVIGASDQVVKSFSGDILKLSRDIPIAATGLQQIAAAGAQMGIPQKQLLRFTEIASKAGVAFDITADKAGESIGKISNIMGVGIDEIENLLGAVNHLSNNMAAKAPEIVNTLQRIGGTAKVFGLTAEEAAALGSAFIALGKPPEVAATGINALLTKMQTATGQSKGFKDALGAIGLSAEELERSVRTKGSQSIVDFLKRIQQLDEAERPKILLELFGQEYQDDISVVATNLGVLEQAFGLANDRAKTASSLQDEFAARSATTANQLQLLQNNFREIGITIGSAILPAFNKLLKAIQPVIIGFADFAQAHPNIVTIGVAIAGVVAAIGPLLIGIGAVVSAIGSLGAVLPAAGAALAAIISPIGLVGVAIAALVVGVGVLIAKWDELPPGVRSAVEQAGNHIKSFPKNIAQVPSAIGAFIGVIKAHFIRLGTEIKFQVTKVTNTFKTLVSAGKAQFAALWTEIKSRFDQIQQTLNSLPSIARNAGQSLVRSFAAGITSSISQATSAVSNLTQRVRDFLPSSPAKVGALSDLDVSGMKFAETFASGISAGMGAIQKAMANFTAGLSSPISSLKLELAKIGLVPGKEGYLLPTQYGDLHKKRPQDYFGDTRNLVGGFDIYTPEQISRAEALFKKHGLTLHEDLSFNRGLFSGNRQTPSLATAGASNNLGISINFSPNITINGGGNRNDVIEGLRRYERELMDLLKDARSRWNRGQF
ncbi:MAG: phage tail tape measure protein [Symploca sp. SIO2C1]|nr:phage tail tape measure protein [Symploca sp. SIO2C1]